MNKLLLLVTLISWNYLFSQTIPTTPIEVNNPIVNNQWVVYVENSEFKIEYKFSNCDPIRGFDFEGVIFRITNLSANKLAFSWHKLLYYSGNCRTCDYPEEYSVTISVPANSSVEGDCNPDSGYDLKLFSKFIDQAYSQGDQLTSFQLGNFTVKY